ncbi:hypothetical protein HYX14_05295 [Candidatus Woesearchaeota archaeon]|nr:hypothetical protein [Candidatus Woesearchaeota archaeon]
MAFLNVGHRGAPHYEPENTLRSWKKAITMGVNAIECDVRLTKDHQVIVIHDQTLNRTTNRKGLVKDFSLAQLRGLDAGKGEKLPTLAEFLSLAKKSKVLPQVEIKDPGMEEVVVQEIIKAGARPQVISFSAETLAAIKILDPSITTGLIFKDRIFNRTRFLRRAKDLRVEWLVGLYKVVNKTFIDLAHQQNFCVSVWVVDKPSLVDKFESWGIDGIASNNPAVFKKKISRR